MHKTSEIARRAGVSVRTLRYYDQIGLLRPTRGPKGTRLYGHEHLIRLQQIRLLQFVGLSLEQIGRLLEEPRSLKESLHLQVRVLTERRAQIDRILRILSEGPDDLTQVIERIEREMNMDWMQQFYDSESWEKLARRAKSYSPEEQQRDQQRWLDLFHEARLHLNDDLHDPKVQELARRFKELVDEFTMGDPKIVQGLRAMQAQAARGVLKEPYTAEKDFLGQALKAGGLSLAGG
ncbi:MAG: MerR family transcriptional regulator [Candidatus Eremiobacteraeota bacterium]|nr:MerR family transcriptional regulator [Candidatus Eremiobacteraeota bacterium]MCW5868579.1 MerR family transcriptional regulator [Candidatus Eremiobacteraeota bacterium]